MKGIAVSLIVGGSFKNVVITKDLLAGLALKLREEGKCLVHTSEESYEVEGLVVSAKGSKNGVMLLPNVKE